MVWRMTTLILGPVKYVWLSLLRKLDRTILNKILKPAIKMVFIMTPCKNDEIKPGVGGRVLGSETLPANATAILLLKSKK